MLSHHEAPPLVVAKVYPIGSLGKGPRIGCTRSHERYTSRMCIVVVRIGAQYPASLSCDFGRQIDAPAFANPAATVLGEVNTAALRRSAEGARHS